MDEILQHPNGMQCITGLYRRFDPEMKGMGFVPIPLEEDEEIAVWVFTGDWGGTEDTEGMPVLGGLVSVAKTTNIVSIFTWFPVVHIAMVYIEPAE